MMNPLLVPEELELNISSWRLFRFHLLRSNGSQLLMMNLLLPKEKCGGLSFTWGWFDRFLTWCARDQWRLSFSGLCIRPWYCLHDSCFSAGCWGSFGRFGSHVDSQRSKSLRLSERSRPQYSHSLGRLVFLSSIFIYRKMPSGDVSSCKGLTIPKVFFPIQRSCQPNVCLSVRG